MEENKDKKQVVLRKISLKAFIDTLVEVYNSGADYIDLIGTPDDGQDTIGIIVHQEYLNVDNDEIELIDDEEEIDNTPLSDKDINDLI